ncbi:MAG: nuclear transport factor 2 family protein [Thermomicrobiales bacterium]
MPTNDDQVLRWDVQPMSYAPSTPSLVERLAREFFAAIDDRDPQRLEATLAPHATFRALPHQPPVRPAAEIVNHFGAVVSSYPDARWEVTDVIGQEERAAVLFVVREPSRRLGRDLISEQIAVFRVADGRIVSIVGFFDSAEFHRVFWDEGV